MLIWRNPKIYTRFKVKTLGKVNCDPFMVGYTESAVPSQKTETPCYALYGFSQSLTILSSPCVLFFVLFYCSRGESLREGRDDRNKLDNRRKRNYCSFCSPYIKPQGHYHEMLMTPQPNSFFLWLFFILFFKCR